MHGLFDPFSVHASPGVRSFPSVIAVQNLQHCFIHARVVVKVAVSISHSLCHYDSLTSKINVQSIKGLSTELKL